MSGETTDNNSKEFKDMLHILSDFEELKDKFGPTFNEFKSKIENEIKNIKQQKQELTEIEERLSKHSKSSDQQIKLNIGGGHFMTTLDTVTTEKNTFFSGLFSDFFNTQPNKDGEYFVDRDPKFFPLILNHWRGVDITENIKAMNTVELNNFHQEIQFYGLQSLIQNFFEESHVDWKLDPDTCSSDLEISPDGLSVKVIGTEEKIGDVIGNMAFSNGIHEWCATFKGLHPLGTETMFVGVVEKSKFRPIIWWDEMNGVSSLSCSYNMAPHTKPISPCPSGTVAECKLNCDEGTFTVKLQGKTWTCDGLKEKEMCPVFDLTYPGCSFEISFPKKKNIAK